MRFGHFGQVLRSSLTDSLLSHFPLFLTSQARGITSADEEKKDDSQEARPPFIRCDARAFRSARPGPATSIEVSVGECTRDKVVPIESRGRSL